MRYSACLFLSISTCLILWPALFPSLPLCVFSSDRSPCDLIYLLFLHMSLSVSSVFALLACFCLSSTFSLSASLYLTLFLYFDPSLDVLIYLCISAHVSLSVSAYLHLSICLFHVSLSRSDYCAIFFVSLCLRRSPSQFPRFVSLSLQATHLCSFLLFVFLPLYFLRVAASKSA